MEQKIKDQIDKAIEILEKRKQIVNKKYETLKKELLTPEIYEMINVIRQHDFYFISGKDSSNSYKIRFYYSSIGSEGHPVLWINEKAPTFNYCLQFGKENIVYSERTIKSLESYVDVIKECEEGVACLERHAEELIEFITDKYREVSENQADRMANILSELDYEETPIKHIKVTVEWV